MKRWQEANAAYFVKYRRTYQREYQRLVRADPNYNAKARADRHTKAIEDKAARAVLLDLGIVPEGHSRRALHELGLMRTQEADA